MARLEDILVVQSSPVPVQEKTWLLNLDMVEQQTGRIIRYNYVSQEELNGSIIGFDENTVLYSKLRPNLNKVVVPDRPGYATSEMLPLKPNPAIIDKDYLAYFLRSDSFVNWAVSKTAGAKMPRLGTSVLLKKEIPLVSLEKQKDIVSELKTIENIIDLRNSQLSRLDELVKSRFIEMFGDPIANTHHLPTISGEEFFKLSNGKFVPDNKRFDSGVPVYGGNGISWYTDETLVSDETIIVGRVGFQSGNVHYAKGPLWVSDNGMYVSYYDKEKYDLKYLYHLMEHIDFTRHQDAGDLKKITQKPFMTMQYILPSMKEQIEYIHFVERTESSRFVIQQALDNVQMLFDSLMQNYWE